MKKVGRFILFAVLVLILLATFRFLWINSRPEVIEYQVVSPIVGSIENTVIATGNVEPRNVILIKPEISGIISKVLKESGDKVKEGDIISIVQVITDPGQLNTAESRLRVAEINLEQVTKDYERQTMLFNKDVISKNEYELAVAGYRRAVEERDNAEDALTIAQSGTSRRNKDKNNTQVRSKVNGMILDIPVKSGNSAIQPNTFSEGTTIASVADMDDLIFKGNIDETEVGRIRIGMPASITIGAIINESYEAVVEYISPKGTKENGTVLYEIKAAVRPNNTSLIRAYYSANAEIAIEQAKDVILVPENSIEFDGGSSYVYVFKQQKPVPQFEKREVEIGLSDRVNVEIKSGLTVNDKIRGAVLPSQK